MVAGLDATGRRRLGRSDIEVGAVGAGCWALGGPGIVRLDDGATVPFGYGTIDEDEAQRAVRALLDAGVTLFDTAANYGAGRSEELLGRALGADRHRVVLATKFGSLVDDGAHVGSSAEVAHLRRSLEGSLRRLGTDHVDLLQLHWGDAPTADAVALVPTLEELVDEGKVRWYGWSTDDPHRAAALAAGPHCATVQHALNVLRDAPEMLATCDAHDLASLDKNPLESGFLTGKFSPTTVLPADDGRAGWDFSSAPVRGLLAVVDDLRDVLTVGGRTMAQGALAWILARSPRTVPLPGFKTVAQATENAAVLVSGPLTAAEAADVDAVVRRHRAPRAG